MIQAKDHFGLVAKVAMGFVPKNQRGILLQDTEEFSDGLVGLARAIRKYDPSFGTVFSTYAYPCIVSAILNGRAIRRRRQRLKTFSIHNEEGDIDIPDRESDESGKLIRKLISLLPEHTPSKKINKQIMIDFIESNTKYKDIAKKLGVSRERVRQRKEEALKDLRTLAEQYDLIGV